MHIDELDIEFPAAPAANYMNLPTPRPAAGTLRFANKYKTPLIYYFLFCDYCFAPTCAKINIAASVPSS